MNQEDQRRVLKAIEQQGDGRWNTPSAPILMLLSEFAYEGKIREISESILQFKAKHPRNGTFVGMQVPAKLWSFWGREEFPIEYSAFMQSHPDWARDIVAAIEDPEQFEKAVLDIDETIRRDFKLAITAG